MKTLAIDFGEKRVGLAVSDSTGQIALPLRTLLRESDAQLIRELCQVIAEEEIEHLVLGEPRGLDGARGQSARRVASFARKLEQHTRLPLSLINESLTSREAESRLRAAGASPREVKNRVDAVAAQILLEEAIAGRRAAKE